MTWGKLAMRRPTIFAALLASAPFCDVAAQTVVCNPAAPLSDRWRNLEASMMYDQIARGDVAGAQRARELVWELAHAPPLPGRWRQIDASMVASALASGDIDGASRVRALVLSLMADAGVSPPACPTR